MQNNYEMIRMCILTFGLAGLSWEDMRKQQLHGWAILLLGTAQVRRVGSEAYDAM